MEVAAFRETASRTSAYEKIKARASMTVVGRSEPLVDRLESARSGRSRIQEAEIRVVRSGRPSKHQIRRTCAWKSPPAVTVLGVKGNQVRVGINAPNRVEVHPEEMYERVKREQQSDLQEQSKAAEYAPV